MVISGMAAKFRKSPANVMREKMTALAGASAISAHAVATSSAAAADRSRRPTPAARAGRGISRAAPRRMPSVAPNERMNPASNTVTAESASADTPGDGERVERRPAVIEHAAREVDDRRGHRAGDRRATARDDAVEEERRDDERRRHPPRQAGQTRGAKQQHRENRDVSAGDGDDVIGAGFLEAPLILLGQARAVADEDGRGDTARWTAPAPHEARQLVARPGTRRRCGLLHRRAAGGDFHERGALDRADQRDPASRERARLVVQARIAIARRLPQNRRGAHGPPGPPATQVVRQDDPADREPHAAAHARQAAAAQRTHVGHVNRDRRPGRRDRPVLAQHPVEQDRLLRQRHGTRGLPRRERRAVCRAAVTDAEGHTGQQIAGHQRARAFGTRRARRRRPPPHRAPAGPRPRPPARARPPADRPAAGRWPTRSAAGRRRARPARARGSTRANETTRATAGKTGKRAAALRTKAQFLRLA